MVQGNYRIDKITHLYENRIFSLYNVTCRERDTFISRLFIWECEDVVFYFNAGGRSLPIHINVCVCISYYHNVSGKSTSQIWQKRTSKFNSFSYLKMLILATGTIFIIRIINKKRNATNVPRVRYEPSKRKITCNGSFYFRKTIIYVSYGIICSRVLCA